MLREDNSGFVHFPTLDKTQREDGNTLVYLVAFDVQDMSNKAYDLSNIRLIKPNDVISDDISLRKKAKYNVSIDELIRNNNKELEIDNLYFPNSNIDDDFKSLVSIPLTTCICIGWSIYTHELNDGGFWCASFRDLTNEGRKLYYSIKKLHNNKEVRILTFNSF